MIRSIKNSLKFIGITRSEFQLFFKPTTTTHSFQLDDPLEEASAFAISSDGLVTTKKALDRECVSEHDLVVMAVDAGEG